MSEPVLFIALDTFSRLGGLQNFNRRIVRSLARRGNAQTFLMRDTSDDIPEEFAGFVRGFGPDRLGYIRAALRAARDAKVMLIGHVNLLPVAFIIKKLNPNLKTVLFVHGVDVWGDPGYRRVKRYEPFLLKGSIDVVASVSAYTAERMAVNWKLPRDMFSVFPNSVDGPIDLARVPGEAPRILSVTRMAQHDTGKNLDKLIRAFARLDRSDAALASATLEIVGDGVLREGLEELARNEGVDDATYFHGRVSDEDLQRHYEAARIFALPSSKEGFGIVFLEAWSQALPVVTSCFGAAPEVVMDGVDGFVVDPDDIDALAERLGRLLKDPDLACRMGLAGASKVASQYLQENLEENLAALLDNLA